MMKTQELFYLDCQFFSGGWYLCQIRSMQPTKGYATRRSDNKLLPCRLDLTARSNVSLNVTKWEQKQCQSASPATPMTLKSPGSATASRTPSEEDLYWVFILACLSGCTDGFWPNKRNLPWVVTGCTAASPWRCGSLCLREVKSWEPLRETLWPPCTLRWAM